MRSDPTVGWVTGRPARPPLVVLVVINLLAVAGIGVTAAIGRPRFFGMAVVFAAAVWTVQVLMVLSSVDLPGSFGRTGPVWEARGSRESAVLPILTDRRTLVAALAVSLAVLGVDGRGLAYFLTVTAFFGGVFARVATQTYNDTGLPGDLWLFAGGSATVAGAQTLTVAYFARAFDAIFHTTYARRIAEFGTLEVVRPGRYQHILLSHTHMSLGMRLTGVDPRTYTAILFAVLVPATLLPVFAVFRNVTNSTRIGLFGAGLLAINPSFLEWAMHVHAQTVNYVLLVTLLLLLTEWRPDLRVTGLVGLVALAAVTTHHLSTVMIVALVTVPVGALVAWEATARLHIGIRSTLVRYVLVVAVAAAYWVETGLFGTAENWVTDTSPQASSDLPTTQFVIRRYDDPLTLIEATVPFLLNNVHYVWFLALAGVIVARLLARDRSLPTWIWFVAVVFTATVVLYVPNPLWAPLRGIAVLNRWDLMVLPFLLLPAVGLHMLTQRTEAPARRVATGVLVGLLVFTSVGAGFSDPSLADLSGNEKGAQRYFTEGHLAASEFVLDNRGGDQRAYGPTLFPGYLQCTSWNSPDPDEVRGFWYLTVNDGQVTTQPGLNVVPSESLREKKIKLILVNPPAYEQDVVVRAPVSTDRAEWTRAGQSVVYDNGGTVIAWQETPDSPATGGVECK